MSTRQSRGLSVVALLVSLGLSLNIGAAEIIGNLSTDQAATVTGQGLEVQVRPGQDYVVFSGDNIRSSAGEGSSVLTIPETGIIKLSADSAAAVERSDGRYLLTVARGEVGFDLVPGAKVFLVNGEELIDLGQGTGKGAVTASANGEGGYLVLVDASGGVRIVYLQTSALVYEGQPKLELIEAQVGGTGGVVGGVGGFGGAGFLAGLGGAGSAALPAALASIFAALAVIDTNTTAFRRTSDDVGPASPVTPPIN
ncbi:hypothetical protein [Thiocapsa rosea]|uniref:Uncharacterized protein n=1 Tax=Thiocapsa rosea TaxID=69360 RepID=A0A495V7L0_9GAMM|nr:hypothetical protein [Thiocapsa rosea]RKT45274.1 hypothetical protein BDD21_2710 [Thiocapsa rosea]